MNEPYSNLCWLLKWLKTSRILKTTNRLKSFERHILVIVRRFLFHHLLPEGSFRWFDYFKDHIEETFLSEHGIHDDEERQGYDGEDILVDHNMSPGNHLIALSQQHLTDIIDLNSLNSERSATLLSSRWFIYNVGRFKPRLVCAWTCEAAGWSDAKNDMLSSNILCLSFVQVWAFGWPRRSSW